MQSNLSESSALLASPSNSPKCANSKCLESPFQENQNHELGTLEAEQVQDEEETKCSKDDCVPEDNSKEKIQEDHLKERICELAVVNTGDSEFQSSAQDYHTVMEEDMQVKEEYIEKVVVNDCSLLSVFSDIISGSLMEDAMVTQCGHSFGAAGLQRVLEKNSCLNCGSSVPSGSLIPNYALRAAIMAYKQDYIKRKPKPSAVFPESSNEKPDSQILVQASGSNQDRPKGVQFPYVCNDRVIIKGNKRTPDRFVGREAVITTQCLNGWYLVRTLDTGESLRLQYRSLQKIGDNANDSNELCSGQLSPSSCGKERKSQPNTQNKPGYGLKNFKGHTSSNTSPELKGEQVKKSLKRQLHESSAEDTPGHTDESADEDYRATKRIAIIGSVGNVVEVSVNRIGSSIQECKPAEGCRSIMKTSKTEHSGEKVRASSSQKVRKNSKLKKNALKSKSDTRENDPYKKVYASGCSRRNTKKCQKSPPLSVNTKAGKKHTLQCSTQATKTEHRTGTYLEYLESPRCTCDSIKASMIELEKKVPWSCMQCYWATCQPNWLKMLHESNAIKDVAKRLQEFRRAVLLDRAGNMSDEEWTKKLEAALGSGETDAVGNLWERLHMDVSKWIESKFQRDKKPPACDKNDFLDAKKIEQIFVDLRFGGMSRTGIIAAASLVAAEAFSDGESDMESLLSLPLKLVNDYSIQDLRELRDSIDREKRYIRARIAQLDHSHPFKGDISIDSPKTVSISPTLIEVENTPLSSEDQSNKQTTGEKEMLEKC